VSKKILLLLLSLVVLLDFSGCVSMSPQARRERAFRHYAQKQIKERRKATARAQKEANRELKLKLKSKSTEPSEPMVQTSLGSVSSESESFSEPVAAPAPAYSEPVAPPVTVSASDAIATQSPDQPSPP